MGRIEKQKVEGRWKEKKEERQKWRRGEMNAINFCFQLVHH